MFRSIFFILTRCTSGPDRAWETAISRRHKVSCQFLRVTRFAQNNQKNLISRPRKPAKNRRLLPFWHECLELFAWEARLRPRFCQATHSAVAPSGGQAARPPHMDRVARTGVVG